MSRFISLQYPLIATLVASTCLSGTSAFAEISANKGLSWSVTPYLWLSDTSVKSSINDNTIADTEIKFRDVVDTVEMAFQGHVEGYGDHFGVFADITYISVADKSVQHDTTVDAEMDTGIYELAALYNLPGKGLEGLSLFAGLRQLSGKQEIELHSDGPVSLDHTISEDNRWTDLMIGARYGFRLSNQWQLGVRADYSNGDTEGAFNLQAVLGYEVRLWKIHGSSMIGYRYFAFDLEEGPLKSEYTMSGPMVGLRFSF